MTVDLPCTAVPDRIGTPILGICNQIEKEMTLQIDYVLECITTSVSNKTGHTFVTVKRL